MMTTEISPEMYQKTLSLLIKHEDEKKRAYLDEYGNITAGIGHNLSARDISDDIILRWAKEDITEFYNNWINTFAWYKNINQARQIALIDFSFIGWKKVLEFEKMLKCCENDDWEGAERELLNSEYHQQVGNRAVELGKILRQGEL